MKTSKNVLPLLLIAAVSLACTNSEIGESKEYITTSDTAFATENEQKKELPFSVKINVEKLRADQYNLSINMFLDDGAYYASPHSNNNFSGLFNIEIAENEHLTVGDTLIEAPFPVESEDQFSDEKVRWVKEETNYRQMLTINSDKDFTVSGVLSTVIEPICNRYEIAFELSWEAGNLFVTQSEPIKANISN